MSGDTDVADIPVADETQFQTGINSLLDDTCTWLKFPVTDDNGQSTTKASTNLQFNFQGTLNATLETSWEIFSGFSLTDVNLDLRANVNSTGFFDVGIVLQANFSAGDVVFQVTGEIPSMQTNTDVDFILSLTLANSSVSLDVRDFMPEIASQLSSGDAIALLPPEIQMQMSDTASLVAGAELTVRRTSSGAYFLQHISVSVEGGFLWQPTTTVSLQDISLSFSMDRSDVDSTFTYTAAIRGTMIVGSFLLQGSVQFSVANELSCVVTFSVLGEIGINPADVLEVFVPGSSQQGMSEITAQLPPELEYASDYLQTGALSLYASVSLSKLSGGVSWTLNVVNIRLDLPGLIWRSPSADFNDTQALTVSDLSFALMLEQKESNVVAVQVDSTPAVPVASVEPGTLVTMTHAVTQTTQVAWQLLGSLQGTLNFRDGQYSLQVQLRYDSTTAFMSVTATIPDQTYAILSDLAEDVSFVPLNSNTPTLGDIANTNPAPISSPVQLTSVLDPFEGSNRIIHLAFSDSDLVRARFMANFNSSWTLTSEITMTGLALLFDVLNPQNYDTRVLTGYICGTIEIGSSTQLSAFVAAQKSNVTTNYWVGLSASLLPNSPLGSDPSSAIADPKLLGQAPPSDGWNLPDTYPVQVASVLQSANGLLQINIQQPAGQQSYVSQIHLQAAVQAEWHIFGSFAPVAATLDLFLQKQANNKPMSGYIDVRATASVTSGSNNQNYLIDVAAHFTRDQRSSDSFELLLSVIDSSQAEGQTQVAPSTIASLDVFGGTTIDQTQLSNSIPDSCPVTASNFTSSGSTIFQCLADVSKINNSWTMARLSFLVSQSSVWQITDSISITNSLVRLDIQNPLTSVTRSYGLAITGTLCIGSNVKLTATVSLIHGGASGDQLKFSITASFGTKFSDLLTAIGTVTDLNIPTQCPIDTNTSIDGAFTADLYMQRVKNVWTWASADLSLAAYSTWNFGPENKKLLISQLLLLAHFADINASKAPTTAMLQGSATFNVSQTKQVNVTVTALLQSRQFLTLQLAASLGNLSPDTVLTKYVASWQATLSAPELTPDTGLNNYQAIAMATAQLSFQYVTGQGGYYSPTTFTLTIQPGSGFQGWELVQDYLKMDGLNLTLSVTDISSSPQLDAQLNGHLSYQSRNEGQQGIDLQLKVTNQSFRCSVDFHGCSFADVVYVVTAGKINLPDLGDWKWPGIKSLYLEMNWANKSGSFVGTLEDWSIPGGKAIVRMSNPRLILNLSKASVRLSSSGMLAGEATIADNVDIPITYELPDGPLRIFGLDVKRIFQMVKRLLELIEDIETICSVLAEIVGLSEGLEVGAALILLGCAANVVWEAIYKFFDDNNDEEDSSSDSSEIDDDDDNGETIIKDHLDKNSSTDQSPPWPWVFGGDGVGPGVAGQNTTIVFWPRKTNGNPIKIDTTQLTTSITAHNIQNLGQGRYSLSYTRPSTVGKYTFHVIYPPTSFNADLVCFANSSPSIIGKMSVLDVPLVLLAGVANTATIWPRDQDGNAVYGQNLSSVYQLTISPTPRQQPTFQYYNDSLQFHFIPDEGNCTISAQIGGQMLTNSPVSATASDHATASQCTAFGPGLCSGIGGTSVTFQVMVCDQKGAPFPATAINCTSSMTSGPTTTQVAIVSIKDNVISAQYDRPAAGTRYSISISINNVPLPDSPIFLKATTTAVTMAMDKSILAVAAPHYGGHASQGTVNMISSEGDRWMEMVDPSTFQVSVTSGSGSPVSIPLTALGAGTLAFDYTFPGDGTYQFFASLDGKTARNAPLQIQVQSPSQLTSLRCCGPAINSHAADGTSLDVYPLDQRGNIIRGGISDSMLSKIQVYIGRSSNLPLPTLIDNGVRYTWQWNQPSDPPNSQALVRVIFLGAELPLSPWLVPMAGVSTVAGAVVEWESHLVKNPSSFRVRAFDTRQNAMTSGGSQIAVSPSPLPVNVDPKTWSFTILSIQDLQDGSYVIQYIPEQSSLELQVTINGIPCLGSPYQLPDFYSKNPRYTIMGDGASEAFSGGQTQFEVQMESDAPLPSIKFHPIMAAILYSTDTSNTSAFVPVHFGAFQEGNVATATYQTTAAMVAGMYDLKVSADFVPVSQYPSKVTVKPSNVPVINDWVSIGSLKSDRAASFDFTINNPNYIWPEPTTNTLSMTETTGKGYSFGCSQTPGSPHDLAVNITLDTPGAYNFTIMCTANSQTYNLTQFGGQEGWKLFVEDVAGTLQSWVPGQPEISPLSKPIYDPGMEVDSTLQSAIVNQTLNISKAAGGPTNYWVKPGWTLDAFAAPIPPGSELMFAYRLRLNGHSRNVNPVDAQIIAPSAAQQDPNNLVVLIFKNGYGRWPIYNVASKQYTEQGQSSILNDGSWHYVVFHCTTSALNVFEDGRKVSQLLTPRSQALLPRFDVRTNVMTDMYAFNADFEQFVTCPSSLPPARRLNSEREIYLSISEIHHHPELFTLQGNWTAVSDSVRFSSNTAQGASVYFKQQYVVPICIQYSINLHLILELGGGTTIVEFAGCIQLQISSDASNSITVSWYCKTNPQQGSGTVMQFMAASKMRFDNTWHTVTLMFGPLELNVFEDGVLLVNQFFRVNRLVPELSGPMNIGMNLHPSSADTNVTVALRFMRLVSSGSS